MFIREITQKIQFLKGIGPKLASIFEKLAVLTVADLLTLYPRTYEDRRQITSIKDAHKLDRAQLLVTVVAHDLIGNTPRSAGKHPHQTLKVFVQDSSGIASLLCFGRNFLQRVFLPGKKLFVSGSFSYRFGEIQSSNFDYEPIEDDSGKTVPATAVILPVYPLTEGLTRNTVIKAVRQALAKFGKDIDDELPANIMKKYRFPAKKHAIASVHFPKEFSDAQMDLKLLKYEELFYLVLIMQRLARSRRAAAKNRATRKPSAKNLHKILETRMSFTLTADQKQAVSEIQQDLMRSVPMTRLLQGDVGCGKTLVAVFAALLVVEAGEQVGLMAPTELLSRQHARTIADLVEPLGLKTAFLSSGMDARQKELLLRSLAAGEIDIIVGTHALFQEAVKFKKLGLVIIDEQHRFGVRERQRLMDKGIQPDLLLMTATPIPRSLALTVFGDLSISTIRTKPAGRTSVITHLTAEGNEAKVYDRVRRELAAGRQAYFVYPLIEETGKSELKNAINMYTHLSKDVFPDFTAGLIHSRLDEEEKRATMDAFMKQKISFLVATSVVEVGVDAPNATVMVVEHAERFGLSQLHQLRG
ncbi:MAG: ATP-dependent DNA helicase RecG, partial [Spirochaetaceae bacterium]